MALTGPVDQFEDPRRPAGPVLATGDDGPRRRSTRAQDWFSGRRFRVAADARLTVDETELGPMKLMRAYHSAFRRPLETSADRGVIVVQLDGELTCHPRRTPAGGLDQGGTTLRRGDALLVPPRTGLDLASDTMTARIEIEFRPSPVVPLVSAPVVRRGARSDQESWSSVALVSLVNAALNAGVDRSTDGVPHLVTAIQACLAAEILRAGGPGRKVRPSADATVQAIEASIVANASDPAFTVELLAESIGLSSRRIRMLLAEAGKPPAVALIRSARTRIALEYLDARHPDRRALTVDEIAELSGFGSRSSLRRALDRTSGTAASEW